MMTAYERLWHPNYGDGAENTNSGLCLGCAEEYLWMMLGIEPDIIERELRDRDENRSRSRRRSVQLGEDS